MGGFTYGKLTLISLGARDPYNQDNQIIFTRNNFDTVYPQCLHIDLSEQDAGIGRSVLHVRAGHMALNNIGILGKPIFAENVRQ